MNVIVITVEHPTCARHFLWLKRRSMGEVCLWIAHTIGIGETIFLVSTPSDGKRRNPILCTQLAYSQMPSTRTASTRLPKICVDWRAPAHYFISLGSRTHSKWLRRTCCHWIKLPTLPMKCIMITHVIFVSVACGLDDHDSTCNVVQMLVHQNLR